MKQIFFVMSILLTLQLNAQTLNVPKLTKIVKVVAKDVNLREAPSASSPRLIRSVGEGGEYSIVWSKATLRGGDEVIRAEALPVVGEAGDWYKAIHNEEGLEFFASAGIHTVPSPSVSPAASRSQLAGRQGLESRTR